MLKDKNGKEPSEEEIDRVTEALINHRLQVSQEKEIKRIRTEKGNWGQWKQYKFDDRKKRL